MIDRVFIASALFLLAVGAPAYAGDALPDVSTIEANVRAANGTVPVNYRDEIQATQSNGIVRHETRFVRGDDYRFDVVGGTIETQSGRYHGDAWHQNANGLTVVHELPPGLETPDKITTTVTAVDKPVNGYRIARLNKRGNGSIEYIDASTWQIVRQEAVSNGTTSATDYGPRVAFGSVNVPRTWHVHNAASGLDVDYTRISYTANVVTDADVAMPPNRRTLVEFPPGVDTVTLPSTFTPDNHIFVRVTVDGIGYDFVLDTGSYGITVDPAAAAKMHLTTFDQMQNAANAGRVETATARIQSLMVGSLSMHDIVVNEVPMTMEIPNYRAVGLLGFDFLAELGVSIDYDHKTVVVHRYGTFTLPRGPGINVIPIRLDSQQPTVTARINGAIAERVLLDTGAHGTFLLFDYFARRHPEALVDHYGLGARSIPMRLTGVGGVIPTRPYDLPEIDLGNVRYVDYIGYVVGAQSYNTAQDGLFGIDFLKVYDVFLDYPDGRVSLNLNDTGRSRAGR